MDKDSSPRKIGHLSHFFQEPKSQWKLVQVHHKRGSGDSVVQRPQLFFLFFGGPTKNSVQAPKRGSPFFSRVTEQLRGELGAELRQLGSTLAEQAGEVRGLAEPGGPGLPRLALGPRAKGPEAAKPKWILKLSSVFFFALVCWVSECFLFLFVA